MNRFLLGLVALMVVTGTTLAQDDPAPKQTNEVVWIAQIAGIGG